MRTLIFALLLAAGIPALAAETTVSGGQIYGALVWGPVHFHVSPGSSLLSAETENRKGVVCHGAFKLRITREGIAGLKAISAGEFWELHEVNGEGYAQSDRFLGCDRIPNKQTFVLIAPEFYTLHGRLVGGSVSVLDFRGYTRTGFIYEGSVNALLQDLAH